MDEIVTAQSSDLSFESTRGAEERISTIDVPKCYLCGSTGRNKYLDLRDSLFGAPGKWRLKECENPKCGLLWLDPMPAENDILKAYRQYYTHLSGLHESETHPADSEHGASWPRRAFRYLKFGYLAGAHGYTGGIPLVQHLAGYLIFVSPFLQRRIEHGIRYLPRVVKGRLLDIGCGDGGYMLLMKKLGWKVEGTEIDPQAMSQVRHMGMEVHFGDVKALGLAAESYDAITVSHVLEHVYDPSGLLRECYRLLKPGGHLRVLVPNPKSWGHKIFGDRWRGLEPPRHLHLFTPEALGTLGERAGFNTEIASLAQGAPYFYKHSNTRKGGRPNMVGRLWMDFKSFMFGLAESIVLLHSQNAGEELLMVGRKPRDFKVQKIGIAMAVYEPNPLDFKEQLLSIVNQSFKNWICVVSFDSPLNLSLYPEIKTILNDTRFVVRTNNKRLGFKKNFEICLKEVLKYNVDAIAFSDQDDVWYSEKLSTLAAELEKRGPGSLVHSDMDLIVNNKVQRGATVWKIEERGVRNVKPHHLLTRNVVTGAASIFDAELAQKFPEVPDEFDFHDHWYALIASCHGGVHPVFRPLYAYRLHWKNAVGVRPFKGILRLPEAGGLNEWPAKLENGWIKTQGFHRAARNHGIDFGARVTFSHVSDYDGGLLLLLQGLRYLMSDRPLSRQSLIQGFGKMCALVGL